MAATPVFDGNTFIGFVVETRGGRFEAAPANRASLGIFNNADAAAGALIAKAREAHPCDT
jgi:hypothetical protein